MNVDSIRSVFPQASQAAEQAAHDAAKQALSWPLTEGLLDPKQVAAQAIGHVVASSINAVREAARLKRTEPTPHQLLVLAAKASWAVNAVFRGQL